MSPTPRVAFFTDTFHEINGVALTSRQLTDFARSRGVPFLCVRGSSETREFSEGQLIELELKRGPLAFALDKGLHHDPVLWRLSGRVADALERFKPDIIHVVSPGDVSEIGVFMARKMGIPLAISWHTNLHEFGAMRLERTLSWMPDDARKRLIGFSEAQMLNMVLLFYGLGNVLYAPNDELVEMLRQRTAKPVFLMKRGIDTSLFYPGRRTVSDSTLRLGYVGRLTPEKNVRFLRDLEVGIRQAGVPDFRLLVVGDGSETEWLKSNLQTADLPGILRGEALAEAYSNMDAFVFPSRTDTFGNVVLEAFASGVPAIVTNSGGPKFIVHQGHSGFVAQSDADFIARTAQLLRDADLRRSMSSNALEQARGESWNSVFEKVYEGYKVGIDAYSASRAAA